MLVDRDIVRLIDKKILGIKPFFIDRLGPVSYDIITKYTYEKDIYKLVSTEEFKLPRNIMGILSSRSRIAKLGLFSSFSLLVDPGYEGHVIFLVKDEFGKVISKDMANLFQIMFIEVGNVATSYDERASSTAMRRQSF